MTDEKIKESRAQFEAWFWDFGVGQDAYDDVHNEYLDRDVQLAWECWQASRDAIAKETAK